MEKIKRLYGLDLARSIAVLMAVLAHSISAYNNGTQMHSDLLQLVLRFSTPTFIIVFGVFLELVYAPDLAVRGKAYVTRKLFARAIQCYTLYVMSCILLDVAEHYGPRYLLRMVLLAGTTPYTDILKFYAAMLLLAPLLLSIRQRYGLTPLIVFCLIVHVVHYFFAPLPYYRGFTGSDVVFGFLYGATTVSAGPSVLHGITFVVTGMWLGQCIRSNLERHRLLDRQHPKVMGVWLACVVTVMLAGGTADRDWVTEFASMKLRNSNSYLYFLFGIAVAILTIDVSIRLAKAIGAGRIKPYLFLGSTSLFVFTFGNCILYITRTNVLAPHIAVVATLASVAATICLSWTFHYARGKISTMASTGPAVTAYNFISRGYAEKLAGKLVQKLGRT